MSDQPSAPEWQVAQGSGTAHVVDPTKPAWRNLDGTRRRSGPRAECGRYPQRNGDGPWFGLPVTEPDVSDALHRLGVRICDECKERVS